jgi:hypothetical protein
MSTHARFVGLLMVVVLLAAVVAAAGPVTYIVTLDDQGNSYYLESNGDGTLGPQTPIDSLQTSDTYGAGIGKFTNDEYYDFVVGTYLGSPSKEIYLYALKNPGRDFQGPDKVGVWDDGLFPSDMPVANFHGKVFDGSALDDFVMVRFGSPDVGLYKNDGNGVFVQSTITGAAPPSSIGAAAADINHDGYADFVVASNEGDPLIYVNLGNGEGSFTTTSFTTAGGRLYAGITAADFDGDYKVDLIATIAGDPYQGNGFDFYVGDGSGGFTYTGTVGSGWISGSSQVTHYDLDGDGDQDLISANLYQISQSAVIVGLNDGTGQFTFSLDSIYPGGSGGARTAIAAPPVFQNEPPVVYLSVPLGLPPRIKAGDSLTFSSQGSYDPEDRDLTYSWQFDPDGVTKDTAHVENYVFSEYGPNPVTLKLTDNYQFTNETMVIVNVNNPPVANPASYEMTGSTPITINLLASVDDEDLKDPLTVDIVNYPVNGFLTTNEDGIYVYTPKIGFTGPQDSFTYRANDGLEDSNEGTVTITFNTPIKWNVNIVPNVINLKSKGVFIAFITLKKPYNANDVQADSVVCEGVKAIRLIRCEKFPQAFGAVFKTSDLDPENVKHGKKVRFTVNGVVNTDKGPLAFSGSDNVYVFSLKNRGRDETEHFGDKSDGKLFEQYPNPNGKGRASDSSEHDGWD